MTRLTARLLVKGTGQAIGYEEESLHNEPAIAQNAIMPIVKKVENNILCIMTAPVIALQSITLKNPVANLPYTLLKAPRALIIKQVHIPMGKLKAAKPQPKLAEAQTQQQHQLHLPISVVPWQVTWGYQSRGKAMQSLMMVDTGAAITLLIKKWADTHGLTIKEKAA